MKKDINNYIYDNGYYLVGIKKNILKYEKYALDNGAIDEEYYTELLSDLDGFNDMDIVVIDYDNTMGYRYEVFQDDSAINVNDIEEIEVL